MGRPRQEGATTEADLGSRSAETEPASIIHQIGTSTGSTAIFATIYRRPGPRAHVGLDHVGIGLAVRTTLGDRPRLLKGLVQLLRASGKAKHISHQRMLSQRFPDERFGDLSPGNCPLGTITQRFPAVNRASSPDRQRVPGLQFWQMAEVRSAFHGHFTNLDGRSLVHVQWTHQG